MAWWRDDRPNRWMQAASRQVTEVTAEADAESAKLRASYKKQVSSFESQLAELQLALNDARATQPLRAAASPHKGAAPQTSGTHGAVAELQQRVEQLESANAALERALLDAHGQHANDQSNEQRRPDSGSAQLQQACAALENRDAELDDVRAELDVLRSEAGAADGGLHANEGGQVAQLRTLVARKESTITASQTRIGKLEALHKLAQESAMKCEAELVSCHESLSRAVVEKQKLSADAQQARCVHSLLLHRRDGLALKSLHADLIRSKNVAVLRCAHRCADHLLRSSMRACLNSSQQRWRLAAKRKKRKAMQSSLCSSIGRRSAGCRTRKLACAQLWTLCSRRKQLRRMRPQSSQRKLVLIANRVQNTCRQVRS